MNTRLKLFWCSTNCNKLLMLLFQTKYCWCWPNGRKSKVPEPQTRKSSTSWRALKWSLPSKTFFPKSCERIKAFQIIFAVELIKLKVDNSVLDDCNSWITVWNKFVFKWTNFGSYILNSCFKLCYVTTTYHFLLF